jgi:hypothetical protein
MPQPVHKVRADVPAAMAIVVAKMMAKKEADRFQTPAQVAAALGPWTQTPVGPPTPDELPASNLPPRGRSGRSGLGPSSQGVGGGPPSTVADARQPVPTGYNLSLPAPRPPAPAAVPVTQPEQAWARIIDEALNESSAMVAPRVRRTRWASRLRWWHFAALGAALTAVGAFGIWLAVRGLL